MKSRSLKFIACLLAVNLLAELIFPSVALALTEGPSQPEVQSFEPVTTNQMVDLFTGDFTYNIPLIDVGGYPINLHYHGQISTEQEASWVGLGWNINPGVVQRNVQGLPDDFNQDEIVTQQNMKPSWTASLSFQRIPETFGKEFLSSTFSVMYNNYKGIGFSVANNSRLGSTKGEGRKPIYSADLGLSYNTFTGIGISPSIEREADEKSENEKTSSSGTYNELCSKNQKTVGFSYSSMQGLTGMTFTNKNKTERLLMKGKEAVGKLSKRTQDNGGVSISFLNQVFTPAVRPNYSTLSLNYSLGFGTETKGFFKSSASGVNFSSQWLNRKTETNKAYGYYYSHLIDNASENHLMDVSLGFTPEVDKHTLMLPPNRMAKDVLNVVGQGVSGVYLPHSSAIGSFIPQRIRSTASQNIGAATQFGIGGLGDAKFGVDANFDIISSRSGLWDQFSGNQLFPLARFTNTGSNADYEPIYFKNSGEKTVSGTGTYNTLSSTLPIRPQVKFFRFQTSVEANVESAISASSTTSTSISAPLVNAEREKRNQQITILTADEVQKWGLLKYRSAAAPGHHYGEVSVTNPDGGRYVYAVPAYNNFQNDVTFAVGTINGERKYAQYDPLSPEVFKRNSGLVGYSGIDQDNSLDNTKGDDHYFNKKQNPASAYSYLLSAVLSPDYQDVDGDGPSVSDYGSYVYINYKQAYSNYKWRTPFTEQTYHASLQKGLNSDPMDDKASYQYGEKEIHYIDTIRTKSHVAIFWTSPRKDAYESAGENGGVDFVSGKSMHKLDSIKVYTIDEFENIRHTGNMEDIIPIKSVYFEYTYELCPGTPNSNAVGLNSRHKGKLTLKSVYFTYGSNKAKVGRYTFDYEETDNIANPDYSRLANDRWGVYKEVNYNASLPEPPEFPYVDQNGTVDVAGVWCMKRIELPSGGVIEVNYEQDDYAYVQDKEAMFMAGVYGHNNEASIPSIASSLYDPSGARNYIVFNKDASFTASDYVGNQKYLYFNYFVSLIGINDQPQSEYIGGYARIKSYGDINANYGYIEVYGDRMVSGIENPTEDGNASPISKEAWQFTRLNLPHIAFPSANGIKASQNLTFQEIIGALAAPVSEAMKMITGYNMQCRIYQRAKMFSPEKSFIRLKVPNGKKKGGGNRVASILFHDKWKEMTGGSGSDEFSETYGQKYTYTTKRNGVSISSGVASYEPNIGNEENPYHTPGIGKDPAEPAIERTLLGVTNRIWNDVPVMEEFYQGAMVGYSEVRVENVKPADVDPQTSYSANRSASGYTVNEFYTTRDYPVITDYTPLEKHIIKNQGFDVSGFLGLSFGKAVASQGFSIINNDMNGKPKSVKAYDNFDQLISGTEYSYKTLNNDPATRKLDNHVVVIKPDATLIEDALIGQETEVFFDPRQMHQSTSSFDLHFDMDMLNIGLAPLLISGIPLKYTYSYTEAKTITATKLVQQYGILESVTAIDNGARITTKNLAWDAQTGDVLVTETQNEYGDPLYNVTIPAHWSYEGMGQAYKNSNLKFTVTSVNGIGSVSTEIGNLLYPGDELVTGHTNIGNARTWVLDKLKNTGNYTVSLIDKSGTSIVDGTYEFRVIRSGRRNQQTMPVGQLVMKTNPLNKVAVPAILDISKDVSNGYKVLNASAITFSDVWQLYQYDREKYVTICEGDQAVLVNSDDFSPAAGEYLTDFIQNSDVKWFFAPGETVNPFFTGLRGVWRAKENFVYYDRENTTASRTSQKGDPVALEANENFNTTHMRYDGELQAFVPFWQVQTSGAWKSIKELTPARDPWVSNTTSTQISPRGNEQESIDALGIYSSALYSGINSLPYAVAKNAKLRNILNENFEDYFANYGFKCDPGDVWTHNSQTYNGLALAGPLVSSNHWKAFNKQLSSSMHWFLWPRLRTNDLNLATKAHSGKQSLLVKDGTHSIKVPIYQATSHTSPGSPIKNFVLNQKDLLDVFSPIPSNNGNDQAITSRTYMLSYWVAPGSASVDMSQAKILLNGITLTPINGQTNEITVEGWTKRQFEFTISSSLQELEIQFVNPDQSIPVYFDDLRIQPKEAVMKTFVYDRYSLRLLAILDENNFATFFEYDVQGTLVRTKIETERGILTVSENAQFITR